MDTRDIIQKLGGPTTVAAELQKRGYTVQLWAVFRWYHHPVPDVYWTALIGMGKDWLTAAMLLEANDIARRRRRRRAA